MFIWIFNVEGIVNRAVLCIFFLGILCLLKEKHNSDHNQTKQMSVWTLLCEDLSIECCWFVCVEERAFIFIKVRPDVGDEGEAD